MTQMPAGWYNDGSGTQRYWDGTAWTDHVVSPAGPVPLPPPHTTPPPITSTVLVTFFFGVFGLIPAIANSRAERAVGRDGSRYWKAFGWSFAASTALYIGTIVALFALLIAVGSSVSKTNTTDIVSPITSPSASSTPNPGADRTAASAAASKVATDLLSYDYRTLEQQVALVTPEVTAQYLSVWKQTFKQTSAVAALHHVVLINNVTDAAVKTLAGDTATVLVLLTGSITSDLSPSPEPRKFSVTVSLSRQPDGNWVASELAMTN